MNVHVGFTPTTKGLRSVGGRLDRYGGGASLYIRVWWGCLTVDVVKG